MANTIADVLDRLPLFSQVRREPGSDRRELLERVAALCQLKSLNASEALAQANVQCESAFILLQGRVSIVEDASGTGRVLREAHAVPPDSNEPPTVLCFWPALTGEPCRISVLAGAADGHSRVVEMPGRALAEACADSRDLAAVCRACLSGAHSEEQANKLAVLIGNRLQHFVHDEPVKKDARENDDIRVYHDTSARRGPSEEQLHTEPGSESDSRLDRGWNSELSDQVADTQAADELDIWHPPEIDLRRDKQGKQFILNCQSCGRIWMRNARLLQVCSNLGNVQSSRTSLQTQLAVSPH